MSALILNSISKTYRKSEKKVLDNLNFQVDRGQIVALLGESGCGKTTLLRIMAGFIDADNGSMTFQNRTIFTPKKSLLPEKREIGFVFQDFALFPHLTVEKNIAFGIKKKTKDKNTLVNHLIKRTGLEGMGKRYPYELSGGQQQRVAIARALAPKPDLILLDEPFNSLDVSIKSRMFDFVRDLLKEFGTTAVFVSHDFKEAEALADKAAIMSEGKIEQYDQIGAIKSEPASDFVQMLINHSVA